MWKGTSPRRTLGDVYADRGDGECKGPEAGIFFVLFCLFSVLGFELRAYTLSHSTNSFL
jgi:hypothetical protein